MDVDTGPAGELTFTTDNENFIAVNTDNKSAVVRLSDSADKE